MLSYSKKQLKEKYGNEQVFIVPFLSMQHVPDKFYPDSTAIDRNYGAIGKYVMRYDAEYNPSLQQLVSYALITNKNKTKFFVADRISGDSRLTATLSIGWGGHINPIDGSGQQMIWNALQRELQEELYIQHYQRELTRFIGTVRDLTSSTSDHVGFIFIVPARKVRVKEKESMRGLWMTIDELVQSYYQFEDWSRHIIDHLFLSNMTTTTSEVGEHNE